MVGAQLLVFDVSGSKEINESFLGTKAGGGETMTPEHNTSISGVAVLRQIGASEMVVDLYHNPFARVAIPPKLASPYVRKQFLPIPPGHNRKSIAFELIGRPDWQ
jgi:hypothetical protein